ncbi:cold shock domain-containing protein [Paenibacillus sp. GD4]|uniref:cold-shock protein n=1 Tax=Paenibacillus sp. GD4 TaxID=3068890 RepID=UPI0027964E14|nr:cold shock domain-containing protein [Paenibacillus sp. GD4]MDQ1914670.1 cold shock domain-containing protein [Paenibacillus sp. GD4]
MSKFVESNVWSGGAGTGDEITWLGPSIARSPRFHITRKPESNSPAKVTGTVIRWNQDRGFGFLKPDGLQEDSDVFVHIIELQRSGIERLRRGDRVAFVPVTRKSGKLSAAEVELINA